LSDSIWTRCAGPSNARRLTGTFRRAVEAQFRNSTRKLVDTDEEQALLEELVDAHAKPPVPAGFENLHYLLSTPFRHPPLRHGSRFGARAERGILYGARELRAAFAEVAYYRLVFLEGSAADLGTVQVELTSFAFGIEAQRAIDLSRKPFDAHQARISSPVSYQHSELLGREMRAAGVQACLYLSARARPRAVNVAVFENVFRPRRPTDERRWVCASTRARVELRADRLLGREERYLFEREQFLVDGALPVPAT